MHMLRWLTLAILFVACRGGREGGTGPLTEVAEVEITPSPPRMLVAFSDTVHLRARAIDANGRLVAGAQVSWEIGGEGVATIVGVPNAPDRVVVIALAQGTTSVTARVGTVEGTVSVTVEQQFARVDVQPASVTLNVGLDTLLQTRLVDSNNNPLTAPGTPVLTYSTSNVSAADVNVGGVVTATGLGNATVTVTATVNGVTKSGQAAVKVSQYPISTTIEMTGLQFVPANVNIPATGRVVFRHQDLNVVHNVRFTSLQPPPPPDIPDHVQGQLIGLTARGFATPGVYSFRCSNHAPMTGQVTVH
ncbi:MAG: hypothetical protein M3373_00805 [Gemmatimonadota bacterium]|nr:hypothetical protein [Gemmatimonadota bacterium]